MNNKLPEVGKKYKLLQSKEIYTIDYISPDNKTIYFKEKHPEGYILAEKSDDFFNNYEELAPAPIDFKKALIASEGNVYVEDDETITISKNKLIELQEEVKFLNEILTAHKKNEERL